MDLLRTARAGLLVRVRAVRRRKTAANRSNKATGHFRHRCCSGRCLKV
jgi:hypothetical protein